VSRVHQFVPTFEPGAVGHHIEAVRAMLHDHGIAGEVFAEHVHPTMQGRARRFDDYGAAFDATPDDLLVYHLAIGSVVGDFAASRPERLVVWYHNVTPPEYLRAWEPRAAPGVAWGLRQLAALAPRSAFAIADSHFNARDLERCGYADITVVPILLDTERFADTPDPEVMARLRAEQACGGIDLLFVGRLAPNKCQYDLVKALAALRASADPMARLRLVGGAELKPYESALRELADALGLADAVEITGSVSSHVLAAYYATADVFVSASEHEGFCVPLLEAMTHDVPVIAYAAAAVPETLGTGGLLLPDKAPALVAAAVARVTRDHDLRDALTTAGRHRLAAFAPEVVAQRLLTVLRAHGVQGHA
jgi:glycosyltransferase involved in cell wall biosynthesis